MPYWCCARLEPRRESVAKHFLGLAGYTVYIPQVRERRHRRGRRIETIAPLFPAYGFVAIVQGWHDARWSIGVAALIMDGERPAKVPDRILDDLRRREINGAIELPKPHGPQIGDPVRVRDGPFRAHLGIYAGQSGAERVAILLSLLGARTRVNLPRRDIEFMSRNMGGNTYVLAAR
jgi:transcriptional antiterminator RfaH